MLPDDTAPMGTPSRLHQIGVTYDPAQDRMVLRVSSMDKSEWRLALTRRFVRLLWGALVGVLERHPDIRADLMPKVREAMLSMRHQAVVQATDFGQPFADGNTDITSNTGPQLVVGGNVRPKDETHIEVRFRTAAGTDIAFALDKERLHAFCHMLVQSATAAEWNLPLAIGDAAVVAPGGEKVH